MARKPLYLTTTLPYVNADPHIGFALEIVVADVVARFWRGTGRSVFFNTGADEHGQKIFQKAKESGQDPQTYVDYYAGRFRELKTALNLSNDAFIRTTSPEHIEAARELWRRCRAAGDIYKKKYKGLYCVGDEAFLKEGDLVAGKCPNHPNMELQEIEEENYFFRLSAYQGKLEQYLSRGGVIIPEWRRKEALAFTKAGLEDFSISREAARMSWGIPTPDDPSQVMYVWFDALTNYVSTLGWPDEGGDFNAFWAGGEVVQMAGKDQVRFQSVMWQAMLMSAGIKNTDKVVYHGFITSGGQKMSKSLGNVVDPLAIVKEYGTDALRLFLARHTSPFEDGDFTEQHFKEAYNADLANGLGNLAARVMALAQAHLDEPAHAESLGKTEKGELRAAVEAFDLQKYAALVFARVSQLDEEIAKTRPFKVVNDNKPEGIKMIKKMVEELYLCAKTLEPLMPEASGKILAAIAANKKPEVLFPRKG